MNFSPAKVEQQVAIPRELKCRVELISVCTRCSLCLSGECCQEGIHRRDTEHTKGAQRKREFRPGSSVLTLFLSEQYTAEPIAGFFRRLLQG